MNNRKCANCNESIETDVEVPTMNRAYQYMAWFHGYCSEYCMVATAMTAVKAKKAWWQNE